MTLELDLKTCCTSAYSHPWARWLLGDSFHPGGLELTSNLAEVMGIGRGSRVLDAGSGVGTSAVHLARTIGCHVNGVTLEEAGVRAGCDLAAFQGVEDLVELTQGNLEEYDQVAGSFDFVLVECVLSILPDKSNALKRLFGLLKSGGAMGISDVTVSGPLPSELRSVLATVGCVGGALSLEGYGAIAEEQGFVTEHIRSCNDALSSFLEGINKKLLIGEVASKLGKLPVSDSLIAEGIRLIAATRAQVRLGTLGYGLLVARKPA